MQGKLVNFRKGTLVVINEANPYNYRFFNPDQLPNIHMIADYADNAVLVEDTRNGKHLKQLPPETLAFSIEIEKDAVKL